MDMGKKPGLGIRDSGFGEVRALALCRGSPSPRARGSCIAIDLPHHRVEVLEFFLVAQFLHELDVDPAPVQVAIEIEQMGLQQRLAPTVDGRPHAETRNTGPFFEESLPDSPRIPAPLTRTAKMPPIGEVRRPSRMFAVG